MKNRLNPSRMAEGVSFSLLGLGMLWLALTRCYMNYVTPRTAPYLYFGAAALLTAGALSFAKIREPAHVHRYTHLLALLIPLTLLGTSTYQQNLWDSPLFPATDPALSDPTLLSETYAMKTPAYAGRVLHGYNAGTKTLIVPEDETYWWLTEIYNNPEPFLGITVTTMGQVLKNPKFFSADCFSPTRKLMTCCVADLYTIGFKCQYDQAQALSEGSWVSVTGKLILADSGQPKELRLAVDSLEACPPPTEPYVYAY